jgi:ABC-2 type transport system ATP-binding protein
MIEVENLAKSYGPVRALDSVSFTAQRGRVTGFLGPNGAGKSTTMRLILGLERADHGTARINGRAARSFDDPMVEVGALIDGQGALGGLTARAHLRALAATHGISRARVEELLDLTGLADAAHRRVRGFSLGMKQRLGLAGALLGDPVTLILDEPINGLDPDGVIWVRNLLRGLADEGRCVFLSSHLMSELERIVDDLVIIDAGRVVAGGTLSEVVSGRAGAVEVRARHAHRLAQALEGLGAEVTTTARGTLLVRGPDSDTIGELALQEGIALAELVPVTTSLEEAYLSLTDAPKENVQHV